VSFAKALLLLPDQRYATIIRDYLEHAEPGSRAMFIVAYDNLRMLVNADYSAARKKGESPLRVEGFIRLLAEQWERAIEDEINSRRYSWFLQAALIGRLDKLSRQDMTLQTLGAECWVLLAGSAKHLNALIRSNIVWKDEEKWAYEHLKKEDEFIRHVLTSTLPAHYTNHPLILEFQAKTGVYVTSRDMDLFPIF